MGQSEASAPPAEVIHTPPPITGYRGLSAADVAAMNEIKAKASEVETLIVRMRAIGADPRWAAIAETDLQKGFMSLTRAIAKPTSF
ncbi:MAG: hypothetical protein WCP77_09220 [Roseococcus sp.]